MVFVIHTINCTSHTEFLAAVLRVLEVGSSAYRGEPVLSFPALLHLFRACCATGQGAPHACSEDQAPQGKLRDYVDAIRQPGRSVYPYLSCMYICTYVIVRAGLPLSWTRIGISGIGESGSFTVGLLYVCMCL